MTAIGTMKAAYLTEPGRVAVREVRVPDPDDGEVLVAVRSAGICGSDLHYFEQGRLGSQVISEPLVLGHECAGEVAAIGRGVTRVRPGDAVAVEPTVACLKCDYCLSGRYNLCPEVVCKGTPPRNHGAMREYLTSPERFVHPLPGGVTMEMGAVVEPLSVALHAVTLAAVAPGEAVTVLGAGPIGLFTVAAAVAAGATDLCAVDLAPARLELAGRMGASRTLNARTADVSDALRDSADVVIDCVGVQQTGPQAVDIVRPGGRIAWVGVGCDNLPVPLLRAMRKELHIFTVFRYAGTYPRALRLLAAGRIDPLPVITDRFEFPRVEEALRFASQHRDRSGKTLVNFAEAVR